MYDAGFNLKSHKIVRSGLGYEKVNTFIEVLFSNLYIFITQNITFTCTKK
jgi:hypothetical protein